MENSAAIAEEFKQYAYSVSHDVGAPVRAMVEFSKLLAGEQEGAFSNEGREYLGLIIENGHKLQAMMDALLRYSRLDTRKSPFSAVAMPLVILDCCNQRKTALHEADAKVDIGEMPTVYGDGDHIRQLILCLLDNTIKFRTPGRPLHVQIAARRIPGFWQFTVTDNGIGIPQDRRSVIFDMFKRLHSDEEYPGVGMGLAIAKKIVRHHNGSIGCDAASPAGTVFHFTLPLSEAAS